MSTSNKKPSAQRKYITTSLGDSFIGFLILVFGVIGIPLLLISMNPGSDGGEFAYVPFILIWISLGIYFVSAIILYTFARAILLKIAMYNWILIFSAIYVVVYILWLIEIRGWEAFL
ncbi:MAG: hypothetical protein ABRQ23_00135 [Syntrophomonadaceae bacterium]